MAGTKKQRKDVFRQEELYLLLEEVELQKHSYKCHTNKEKQKIWDGVATKLTATRGIKRSGKEVRKKWQDYSSLAKRKRALQRTISNKTGGGPNDAPVLTAEEEKVLSILGPTASDGICGGIDLHGGVGLCQPEPEPGPSCSQEQSGSPPADRRLQSSSPPISPSMPQPPSSIVQATATTPQRFENVCGCSQDLVQLERDKRDVLKDIRQCVKEANEMNSNFHKQIIDLKKAKLALEERRILLEEMRYARPSISVPNILPDPGEQTTNVTQNCLYATF